MSEPVAPRRCADAASGLGRELDGILVVSIAQAVAPVSYNANFQAHGNNVPVQFRAWIPDGYERIKGLIVSLPGSRGDHRGIVSNTQWQFRLSQMGYGIVGFRPTAWCRRRRDGERAAPGAAPVAGCG